MHARLVVVMIKTDKTDKIDDAIRIFRETLVPAAKAQKGYKGGDLLVDRSTGKLISESVWETEADMKAGETSDYLREQIAKLAPTFAAAPSTEHYEVALHT